ncbi:MAG: trypsin-like serine protease [Alphaproteobacteria bacterium]|nr:trypsin-like serine protease [Alphaproteobacteria bacterium]
MADIEDIKEFLLGSILQVTYLTKDKDPLLWRKGSSFIISYKNNFFIATASHCIDKEYKDQLFFSNFSNSYQNKFFSIPLSKEIISTDNTGEDRDFRLFKINLEEMAEIIQREKGIPTAEEIYKKISNMPLISKIRKRYKNNQIKCAKKIKETKIFQKHFSEQDFLFYKTYKSKNCPFSKLKTLKFPLSNFSFLEGTECSFCGYSYEKSEIKYIDTSCSDTLRTEEIHQHFQKHSGILTGDYNKNSDSYSLRYSTDEDLNGLSGGPVLSKKGELIGIISFIEANNKILKFTPYTKIQNILKSL